MNSKLKRVFFGFGCAVSLFACGSTGVSAEWEDLYGISEGTYFLIIFSPRIHYKDKSMLFFLKS